jgi:hypothetical protein
MIKKKYSKILSKFLSDSLFRHPKVSLPKVFKSLIHFDEIVFRKRSLKHGLQDCLIYFNVSGSFIHFSPSMREADRVIQIKHDNQSINIEAILLYNLIIIVLNHVRYLNHLGLFFSFRYEVI